MVSRAEGIVLFDVLDAATQLEAGRQLLRLLPRSRSLRRRLVGRQLCAGEGAGRTGEIPAAAFPHFPPVDRIIAVSGSCSPTTARQIRHALAHGFTGLHADPLELPGSAGGRHRPPRG